MDLALSPLPCEWRCGPWRRWSCGGLVTRLSGIETPSALPGWVPGMGCPAAGHNRPTWNVYHVILELSGEKCVPRLQASQPRQSLGVPRGLAAPRANPSPSLAGGWRRESPVPSGARSRRIRSMFSTQPGTTSFRPGRPDPRFGSGSGIHSGPAPEAAQRPGGYACGSSPRRRAGWLWRLLRPGVDYNGSLLCLGHFKEKFSSMNIQPASLAHG